MDTVPAPLNGTELLALTQAFSDPAENYKILFSSLVSQLLQFGAAGPFVMAGLASHNFSVSYTDPDWIIQNTANLANLTLGGAGGVSLNGAGSSIVIQSDGSITLQQASGSVITMVQGDGSITIRDAAGTSLVLDGNGNLLINGVTGFTGIVTPVTSISVTNGIVTDVS